MTDQPLTPVSREELVQEIALRIRFEVRKRLHNSEVIMTRVAAEKMADHLRHSNFLVVHGPDMDGHTGLPHRTDRGSP